MERFQSGDADYEAALSLAWLSRFGCSPLLQVLELHGPSAIWSASRRTLLSWGFSAAVVGRFARKREEFKLAEAHRSLEGSGLHFVPYGSSHYPEEFLHLRYPPAGLFVKGSKDALVQLQQVPRITIVGTRKATAYGLSAAEVFGSGFAARGIAVVSGMAMGIDARVHEAALDAGGLTVAILGCGADIAYPRRHRQLHRRLSGHGVVMSELPPGSPPSRWTFPHRNRLLAALGDAVLVIEGSRTSGAMQTVGHAIELGRSVFAVPGSIMVEGHQGCNWLLYDGASPALDPVVTVEDFLHSTRIERRGREVNTGACSSSAGTVGAVHMTSVAVRVAKALGVEPCSMDVLLERTGMSVRQLAGALAELELAGGVRRTGPGHFMKVS